MIKDRIKLAVSERGDHADWSMLAEAGRKWRQYSDEWAAYCKANNVVSTFSRYSLFDVRPHPGLAEYFTSPNRAPP